MKRRTSRSAKVPRSAKLRPPGWFAATAPVGRVCALLAVLAVAGPVFAQSAPPPALPPGANV
ncbi:MAG: hypothetical protein WBD71_13580, partial [Xanthobacteraceae bacterium]